MLLKCPGNRLKVVARTPRPLPPNANSIRVRRPTYRRRARVSQCPGSHPARLASAGKRKRGGSRALHAAFQVQHQSNTERGLESRRGYLFGPRRFRDAFSRRLVSEPRRLWIPGAPEARLLPKALQKHLYARCGSSSIHFGRFELAHRTAGRRRARKRRGRNSEYEASGAPRRRRGPSERAESGLARSERRRQASQCSRAASR